MMRDKLGVHGGVKGLVVVVVLALVGACAPDIPEDEDVERTQVVFDPDQERIPLPSDLALEDDGTVPDLPGADEASAQGDLLSYMSELHGWLPTFPIIIPVDGPIDGESLDAEDLVIFEFDEEGGHRVVQVAEIGFNEQDGQIEAEAEQPLSFDTEYGYVLTSGVDDAEGEPLIASQAQWLAFSEEPLVDEEGEPTVSVLEGREEEAQQLEELRQFLSPVVEAALEEEIERDDVIAASKWHTPDDAFAVFDPETGRAPFPIEQLREDDSVALPTPEDADELTEGVIAELNRRQGFSITADGWIPVDGAPLDASTVTPENIPLAFVEGLPPELYSEDRYGVEYREEFDIISYFPERLPFEAGLINAGLVTTDVLDEEGRPIKPTPAFILLRSQHRLFEDGESTVDQLTDEEAEQLEEARQGFAELFTAAQVLGFTRDQIAVAWPFQTDNSPVYQQRLNAVAVALANEGGSPAAQGDPQGADSDPDGFTRLGLLQEGAAYTTRVFVDQDAEGGLADEPVEQPVPISIAVPDEGECGEGPYPPVIVAHGLGGDRAGALGVLGDTLAAACLAVVVPDLWLHGERTPDGSESGELFLTANPIATKNNFLQAVVDLAVLVEVIEEGGLEGVLDADEGSDLIEEESIGFAGLSLGALLGPSFLATVPEVDVGALHGAGAKLTAILLQGSLADQILPELPGDIDPESFDFYTLLQFLQWVVEPSDPWTFAPHVQSDPLDLLTYDPSSDEFSAEEAVGANEVLLQMAGEDDLIPNATTELLAAAIGISLDDTTFAGAEHGFVAADTPEGDCARRQIAAWLASGLEDVASLPSELENACGG